MIEEENEVLWTKRKEKEIERKETEEKELEKERRKYRARLQKEEFLRKYMSKKKESMIWSREKIAEKKIFWRKYREKEEDLDLDQDEKMNVIACLMTKIPERKLRLRLCEDENRDPPDPQQDENESTGTLNLDPTIVMLKSNCKTNDGIKLIELHPHADVGNICGDNLSENASDNLKRPLEKVTSLTTECFNSVLKDHKDVRKNAVIDGVSDNLEMNKTLGTKPYGTELDKGKCSKISTSTSGKVLKSSENKDSFYKRKNILNFEPVPLRQVVGKCEYCEIWS